MISNIFSHSKLIFTFFFWLPWVACGIEEVEAASLLRPGPRPETSTRSLHHILLVRADEEPTHPRFKGRGHRHRPHLSMKECQIICGYFFFNLFIYLFIYFWLCWVFVSVQGLSLVLASGGHSSSRCAGLSLSWPLLLRSTGSRRAGSVVVANGPSCSAACGILPDQGSNPCPLHWQADSQPLRHQGSPCGYF